MATPVYESTALNRQDEAADRSSFRRPFMISEVMSCGKREDQVKAAVRIVHVIHQVNVGQHNPYSQV